MILLTDFGWYFQYYRNPQCFCVWIDIILDSLFQPHKFYLILIFLIVNPCWLRFVTHILSLDDILVWRFYLAYFINWTWQGLIKNIGQPLIISKKGFFSKKGHLKFQHHQFKPVFKGFTTKQIFLNIYWERATSESWMHFLSRLGPAWSLGLDLQKKWTLDHYTQIGHLS